MSITFADMPLHSSLHQAVANLGFSTPTAVQQQAIGPALDGKDLLVSSQTGSGKTIAFLLPTINRLTDENVLNSMKDRMRGLPSPSILVLCPTRELAQQVSQDAINLVRQIKGIRVATVMGGMPFGKQLSQIRGAQVLVATPGRLLDLVNRRQLNLSEVFSLIVDEADRMLDLGFSEDLESISDLASNRDQTLMFSATFADRIIHLAERMTNNPQRIAIETGHSTNRDVSQTLHWTNGFEHKKKLLTHWLKDEALDQAVVFASTQEDTDLLAEELSEAGHSVVALHGAMPQTVRNRRLRSIREGRARILVATDVAARGLDVPTISHVINFGLPMKNEDYVHRIGRTGRAGRSGQAITLATYREQSRVRALEGYLKTRLDVTVIEGLEPSPPPERSRRNAGDNKKRHGGRSTSSRRFEGESNFRKGDRKPSAGRSDYSSNHRAKFDSDRPRRSASTSANDDNRGNRVDYQPPSSGYKKPMDRGYAGKSDRAVGDRRRSNGGGYSAARSDDRYGNDRPRFNKDSSTGDRRRTNTGSNHSAGRHQSGGADRYSNDRPRFSRDNASGDRRHSSGSGQDRGRSSEFAPNRSKPNGSHQRFNKDSNDRRSSERSNAGGYRSERSESTPRVEFKRKPKFNRPVGSSSQPTDRVKKYFDE